MMTMDSTFHGATLFNVSSVTTSRDDMAGMFMEAKAFNQSLEPSTPRE